MILMMDVDDDDDVFDAVMIAQSTQTWFVVRIVVAVLTRPRQGKVKGKR